MSADLLKTLQTRFEKHPERHPGLAWPTVEARLKANPEKLQSLHQMEETGGEPDVVQFDPETHGIHFYDCAPESPKGRRSLCYDPQALEDRKEHKPKGSCLGLAEEMGVQMLDEAQYRFLQTLGEFDLKTSSWILTPPEIRSLNGALFCDRRFDHVFTYHNTAPCYYASRGFRACLVI